MQRRCFITSVGQFLPGEPVTNEQMEARLGQIGPKPSGLRERVLRQNRIEQRYYAIDDNQHTTHTNAQMAARAVRDAIAHSTLDLKDVRLLVAATSQGDLPLPGFASMVHGELDMPPCEIATIHGICASSVVALRHAALAVGSGEVPNAVCVASEFASRLLKASRFRAQGYGEGKRLPFETEFLRWMLSDGAGALLLANEPAPAGLSLEIETIALKSYASQFPPCMFVGNRDEVLADPQVGWLDHPDYETASRAGAINLHQSTELLTDVVRLCVNGVFELIEEGKLDPKGVDWWVTHYSSHLFREQANERFVRGGLTIDPERVFTNLYTSGNVGSASFPLMLGDLFRSGKLEPGQRIVCIVPESGRFMFGYVILRVVGSTSPHVRPTAVVPTVSEPPDIKTSGSPLEESLVRQLAGVWTAFETRLNRAPIVAKMFDGRVTLQDYRDLLFNLRQQVIDGSRWISRAASNVTREHFPIRSAFIGHSRDEHRDFEMIERDYVSVGGNAEEIRAGQKNIGSTALSEYILSRASRENPFDLIGAMFIIEGLGRRVAARWAELIRTQLNLDPRQVSFLAYHSASDDVHFERLDAAVQSGILTEKLVDEIVTAAKVVARLYVLQLEEIGNF
ncbi:3-oxoacyl-[acyl-carrier-protein] synthase 3 [Gemmata sp. SH-PL17]|uniref:3-oxoacyl-[acyl-carrier-protein] synthase III C-terminal domain-containing protein n=1 Tax=Gemmata sp. SH-PL17 TaxID=1630693 RepID=UPI00078DA8C0|nr:3-oxoacyl-[acyl-carrier-protein] synthase III C-terminal domain-containing protein [Gemmata sp. SH-PL17]AMV23577.1 3-oxoacyl-[acyl-carrier-protein] synthase 3 [Gemmata sp. SH-PL17]